MNRVNILTYKCSLNTINLKLFRNHGGIYRFRRKFKKDSGEINPLRVYRNIIIDNRQYVCLLFCWSWPKGSDNFQKREDSWKWEDWFWNSGYGQLCTLVLVHQLIPFLGFPFRTKHNMGFFNLRVPRKIWWAVRICSFCSKLRYFTDQNRPKGGHKKMNFDHF